MRLGAGWFGDNSTEEGTGAAEESAGAVPDTGTPLSRAAACTIVGVIRHV
jgi:hypothetical protein